MTYFMKALLCMIARGVGLSWRLEQRHVLHRRVGPVGFFCVYMLKVFKMVGDSFSFREIGKGSMPSFGCSLSMMVL